MGEQLQDVEVTARIASLSEREREVTQLVAEGLQNRDVANRLAISMITVRHHLTHIFDKLQVKDRYQLAIFAMSHGVVNPPALVVERIRAQVRAEMQQADSATQLNAQIIKEALHELLNERPLSWEDVARFFGGKS